MIHEERLGEKHIFYPNTVLEMVQLVARLKAFHSSILKMNFKIQEVKFSYSFEKNINFNHSLNVKMSLEDEKARNLRIETSKYFEYSKHLRIHYLSKRESINKQNLGMAVRFGVSSLINGSNETPRCELSSLTCVLSIKNGAPR